MVGDYGFIITNGAKSDFQQCKAIDGRAAAEISILLREIKDDGHFLECMVDESYADGVIKSVMRLYSLQEKRIDGYRVKLFSASNWRLIWIADHPSKRIGLFSIMPRSADYENDVALWSRIEREFNEQCFTPRWSGRISG